MNIISQGPSLSPNRTLYYFTASTQMINTEHYLTAYSFFFTYNINKGYRTIGAHLFRLFDHIGPSAYLTDLSGITHLNIFVDYNGFVDRNVFREWTYLRKRGAQIGGYFPDGRTWSRIELQPIPGNSPERYAVFHNLATGERSACVSARKAQRHG